MKSRGGKGIKAMNLTPKTGRLTCQLLADEAEDILLITDDGTIIRVPVGSISTLGRTTQGVRYDCAVPPNTTADLLLPGGVTRTLAPGRYSFDV